VDPTAPPKLAAYSPVWEKSRAIAVSVNAIGGLKIDALASCASNDDGKQVGQTCEALLTLARNMMQGIRAQADRLRNEGRPAPRWMPPLLTPGLVDPLLEKASVTVESGDGESAVRVVARADVEVAEVAKSFLPAVANARAAAVRSQSRNNLKQIGLAMWNYHNDKGHLPPAVGIGPDGKTRYSWRVALLPYLAQNDLYEQYRFDEPWDGPNNRKLIAKMPPIYRYPDAGGDPTRPTYFVLTGPDTLFADNKGTAHSTVRDGISNTIAVVEAKRDIPWTKPEDIPYDVKGPLPQVGGLSVGGFNCLFADGAVRFLQDTIKPDVLRAMISPAGGEAFEGF
jgi:prepilin-type processing-associated H-X9-DG protein